MNLLFSKNFIQCSNNEHLGCFSFTLTIAAACHWLNFRTSTPIGWLQVKYQWSLVIHLFNYFVGVELRFHVLSSHFKFWKKINKYKNYSNHSNITKEYLDHGCRKQSYVFLTYFIFHSSFSPTSNPLRFMGRKQTFTLG